MTASSGGPSCNLADQGDHSGDRHGEFRTLLFEDRFLVARIMTVLCEDLDQRLSVLNVQTLPRNFELQIGKLTIKNSHYPEP